MDQKKLEPLVFFRTKVLSFGFQIRLKADEMVLLLLHANAGHAGVYLAVLSAGRGSTYLHILDLDTDDSDPECAWSRVSTESTSASVTCVSMSIDGRLLAALSLSSLLRD